MPTYMIVTAKIADRDAFLKGYGARAGELVEQFGGRYVLRGPGAELLEGEFGDGASMVISQAIDHFFNCYDPGSCDYTCLAHTAAKEFPGKSGFFDEFFCASQDRTHRCGKTFGQAKVEVSE